MAQFRSHARSAICLASMFIVSFPQSSWALDRTWIGGVGIDTWSEGVTAGWNPADEPDTNDTAIFNTSEAVSLGSNNSILALTMSGGIDLFTNDFDLTVDGLVEVAGAGSNLFIEGAAGSINADDVVINADGTIELRGGLLQLDEEAGTSLIDINVGGNLIGNGTIQFLDTPGVATLMLVNDGELTALSRGVTIFSPPPVGTLTISDDGLNGRLDLDGAGEAGIVNVNRNQTLATEMQLFDTFNGTLNLFHNSTFQFNPAFTIGTGGSIIVDNGFVAGGIGFSDILADTSYIESAGLTQSGGTINVVDTDGTLQIDAPFTMSGGSFTNSGTVVFNGVTSITTATGYNPNSLNAQTIVNANVTINDAAGNFNWDGNGAADTTVNGSAQLSITANMIDSGDNVFGGTINLNDSAVLSVNNTLNQWQMFGALNKNNAGTSSINGDQVFLNGITNVNAGTLDVNASLGFTNSTVLNVDAGASLISSTTSIVGGNLNIDGTLSLGPLTTSTTDVVFDGTGTVRFNSTSTLSVNTTVNTPTFDWDGAGSGSTHTINAGVVFTINSTTFDNDGVMNDPINLAGSGSTLIVNNAFPWAMVQAINANNAGVGTATIGGTSRLILTGANADLTANGNTNVTAPLTIGLSSSASVAAGFTLDADGDVIYDGASILGLGTYDPGVTNTVTGQDAQITSTVFDFDAGSWVVEAGGFLDIDVSDYDTTVTNAFDSTITLNSSTISVNTADAEFVMDGVLNSSASGIDQSLWTGEALDIGNDAGVLDADVNISGSQPTQFGSQVDFNSDADMNVADGATAHFLDVVNFNSVNGGNNAEFTGSGEIIFSAGVNFSETTTLNMAGGTVDLDGADSIGDTLNVDAPLTINAELMRSFGKVNAGGGVNTLDVNNSVGTGVLTVNLDNAADEWTLNGPGTMNLVNDNTEATLLAGNDVNINGTVNVTGDVRTTARVDIGSTGVVNINTAAQPLRLAGGDNAIDANTISGGTISGPGLLGADTGKALHGFGAIALDVDFDGTANLRADNGTLTLTGALIDVNILGTLDTDAILNIPGAWNTSTGSGAGSVAAVSLFGGTLQGGTITNDNGTGIQGFGTVTSRVINNTQLLAGNGGGTLIFQTAGNDNDWDGAANTGELSANTNATLELRDNATFGFTGSVTASPGGRVFSNGFALDFNPGSSIELTGATYQSTSSTNIGGTVTVNAGANSTIEVTNNFFLTFEAGSVTTLGSNLRLVNNNIGIDAGATFSGGGALIVPDGSHLVADNLANIGVLLDMQGAFRPGNSEGIGRIDLVDYQQANSGELFAEITGTSLNAFDRLVASGDVVLDGYLNIDIDGAFVPALGNTFNIITGNSVTGEFDYADVSGMPAGLTFHIEYLLNAVQLQVVSTPFFSADFDNDGDVDPTDLAIWQGAYDLNQLGDADGDNDSDGRDFLLWQQQFGAAPLVAVSTAASTAVPEPSGLVLAAGVFALLGWRRR